MDRRVPNVNRAGSDHLGPLLLALSLSAYALFPAANEMVILMDVGPEELGVISGLLSLSRNLGLIR